MKGLRMQDKDTFYMLNALWYKPDGGEEMYKAYVKAVTPLLDKHGARIGKGFKPNRAFIGEFDADLFFVVEWPGWHAFKAMANSPEYDAIRHLREDALEKSLLIQCEQSWFDDEKV